MTDQAALDPSEGTITEIRDDTFWGVFNDGMTFDVPLYLLDGHGVGTKVVRVEHDEGDRSEGSFLLIGEDYATVIEFDRKPEGYEVVHATHVPTQKILDELV